MKMSSRKKNRHRDCVMANLAFGLCLALSTLAFSDEPVAEAERKPNNGPMFYSKDIINGIFGVDVDEDSIGLLSYNKIYFATNEINRITARYFLVYSGIVSKIDGLSYQLHDGENTSKIYVVFHKIEPTDLLDREMVVDPSEMSAFSDNDKNIVTNILAQRFAKHRYPCFSESVNSNTLDATAIVVSTFDGSDNPSREELRCAYYVFLSALGYDKEIMGGEILIDDDVSVLNKLYNCSRNYGAFRHATKSCYFGGGGMK